MSLIILRKNLGSTLDHLYLPKIQKFILELISPPYLILTHRENILSFTLTSHHFSLGFLDFILLKPLLLIYHKFHNPSIIVIFSLREFSTKIHTHIIALIVPKTSCTSSLVASFFHATYHWVSLRTKGRRRIWILILVEVQLVHNLTL